MKYRELLQAYKDGTLDEKKRIEVEKDIEKQDAISDYLFENADIPGIDEVSEISDSPHPDANAKNEVDDFAKMINLRIRRAFIKAGLVTALITLVIVGFVIFALPRIVDDYYYNPLEEVGTGNEKSNRLTIDIAAYSELFLPTRNIWNADAVSRGYGDYYVSFFRNESSYAGSLEKGQLRLYNPDAFKRTIKLAYATTETGESTCLLTSPKGNSYSDPDFISYLGDYHGYSASVTMTKAMRYDDFVKWCKINDIDPLWCAISTYVKDGNPENLPILYSGMEHDTYAFDPCIGFGVDSFMRMNYDSEKYPNLSAMDWMQAINDGASEYDTTLEHVNSMLDYLIDNPEIIKLLIDGNADPDTLKSYKKHIEQYGLYIYGFVVSEDKSGLEKLQNNAEVAHIMIDADY